MAARYASACLAAALLAGAARAPVGGREGPEFAKHAGETIHPIRSTWDLLHRVEADEVVWLVLVTRGPPDAHVRELFELLTTLPLGPPRHGQPRSTAKGTVKFGTADLDQLGSSGAASLLSQRVATPKLVLYEAMGERPVDLPFDASDSVEIFEAQRHIGMRMDLHAVSKGPFWLKTEAESPPRPRDEL